MTVFMPGMRVKKIFHPKLNRQPEVDYVGRITKRGFIKLQGDLEDPYRKYWLTRPNGMDTNGWYCIVPDNEEELARLQRRKTDLLRELEDITQKAHALEQEMEVSEGMWTHKRVE